MNIKKILAAGVLALGAIGLMAGCGGDQKSAGSAAKSAAAGAKPTKIVAGMDDTFAPMGFRLLYRYGKCGIQGNRCSD